MLSLEEFRGFAKTVVPFLHVTSRIEGEKHGNLLGEKGGKGFPYLVAMDAEGEVIGSLEERTVAGFEKMMRGAKDYQSLRTKQARSPAEEVRLVGFEISLDKVKGEEARKRLADLEKPDAETVKARDALILGLDVTAVLEKTNAREPAQRVAAGKEFAAMWKEGRRPTSDEGVFQPFFIFMLDYAEGEKDAALFEKALGELRAKFGKEPNAEKFFKTQDDRLAKLKAAK